MVNSFFLSIIVPIYKVEKTIKRCIDSIIPVLDGFTELVLVNDGSPDNSATICAEYLSYNKNIILLNKKNGGLSSARNFGFIHSKGNYIIFVDSDDYVDTNELANFINELKKLANSSPDIVAYDAIRVTSNDRIMMKHVSKPFLEFSGEQFIYSELKKGYIYPAWMNAYNSLFLRKNNLLFYEGILHEDIEFCYKACLLAKKIVYINLCFYYYEIHDNTITTSINKQRNFDSLFIILQEYISIFNKNKGIKAVILDSIVSSIMNLLADDEANSIDYDSIDWKMLRKYSKLKNRVKISLFSLNKNFYRLLRKKTR